MTPAEQTDKYFRELQRQAKELGVSVIEMLLTGSALYWAIKLNGSRQLQQRLKTRIKS